jgi:ABC-2 type transport system permease protein
VTTLTAPPAESLRWVFADSWTIARAELLHWVRNPA